MKFLIWISLSLSTTAWGWPPTIGPELTFESSHIEWNYQRRTFNHYRASVWTLGLWKFVTHDPRNPTKNAEQAAAVLLKDKIMTGCSECGLQIFKGKWDLDEFKITFPNGYWVVIAVDPGAV